MIVGKRALPALGLTGESARSRASSALIAEPDDIVIAFGEPARRRLARRAVAARGRAAA